LMKMIYLLLFQFSASSAINFSQSACVIQTESVAFLFGGVKQSGQQFVSFKLQA